MSEKIIHPLESFLLASTISQDIARLRDLRPESDLFNLYSTVLPLELEDPILYKRVCDELYDDFHSGRSNLTAIERSVIGTSIGLETHSILTLDQISQQVGLMVPYTKQTIRRGFLHLSQSPMVQKSALFRGLSERADSVEGNRPVVVIRSLPLHDALGHLRRESVPAELVGFPIRLG